MPPNSEWEPNRLDRQRFNRSNAPAGWYPTPAGDLRYWDGSAWLKLPPPEDSEQPAPASKKSRKRGIIIGAVVAFVILLGIGGGGYLSKTQQDQRAAEGAAQLAQEERQAAAEAQEAARLEAEETAEKEYRASTITDIEKTIKKDAKSKVKEDLLEGPILRVSYDPLARGSIDNLDEKTTTFECFVATKDNKDGSSTGFFYHATMNWDSGSYTYGVDW